MATIFLFLLRLMCASLCTIEAHNHTNKRSFSSASVQCLTPCFFLAWGSTPNNVLKWPDHGHSKCSWRAEVHQQTAAGMYPAPPHVLPHPLSFPRGGVGDRHLVNPNFFVAAHYVVVWVTVLWGTATTFCPLSLKWNLTAQPCGVWGMGHSFGNKLYFTRDIPERKWVPKDLLAPAKPPTKKAKPPPKSAAQSIPVESGEHVQEFKVKGSRTKKFYTKPVKE